MKFTDKLAQYIVDQQLDLDHLTIILPSERAKKYISASLFRAYGKPVLAPEMITIDRWVKGLSDKTVIDRTRALIRLFKIQLIDPSPAKMMVFPVTSSAKEFGSMKKDLEKLLRLNRKGEKL